MSTRDAQGGGRPRSLDAGAAPGSDADVSFGGDSDGGDDDVVHATTHHRLLGLAAFYLRLGELRRARRLLDVAREAGADEFHVAMASGRLAILEGRGAEAAEFLEAARRLDPFDEDTCDLLGQVLRTLGRHREAIASLADASLLAGRVDADRVADYTEQVEAMRVEAGLDAAAIDAIRAERARLLEEAQLATEDAAAFAQKRSGIEVLAEAGPMHEVLRGVAPFSALDEPELRLLECTVQRIRVPKDEVVFREGQPSEEIYVVETGKVLIQRETPFGNQVLATVPAHALFGEMNFIDGLSRSADAVAAEETTLLRINHDALREIFKVEPGLGLTFLEAFWRGLADKVREGNELMKTFFPEGQSAPPAAPLPAAGPAGKETGVAHSERKDVLREKGLTAEELSLLTEFAQGKTYDVDEVIFHEGVPGETLYIVVEGKVRIEKAIPGVGKEALAVLERGDFFGEMAIVDRAPRSASAVAHVSGTTVLGIAKGSLDALLRTGGEGAHGFLLVLCRILSTRLREINDKIVQWKCMSGGF